MPFGCAEKWRQLGARLIASTKQISPTPRVLVTYSPFYCRLRMTLERKYSLLQLGCCRTREMPFTFVRTVRPTAQILSMAGNLLQDFLAVQQIDTALPPPPTTQHWNTPDLNFHIVNFDAAMFRDSHFAGVGVVA